MIPFIVLSKMTKPQFRKFRLNALQPVKYNPRIVSDESLTDLPPVPPGENSAKADRPKVQVLTENRIQDNHDDKQ